MSDHKGTAMVTGASTGIGAVYADRLVRRGRDLVLVARDARRLESLAVRLRQETGRVVDVLPADLTDDAAIDHVAKRIEEDGRIDLLVNNAGMAMTGGLLDNDAAAVRRIIALNVTAPTLLAGAAGRAFSARGGGAIVNIASVLAVAPELFEGVYSGTKAHLLNLSLSLAGQLADRGVHVQAVLPGATRTEIWERSGQDVDAYPPEFVMDAGDLVDAALLGLDRGETVTIPPLADEGRWTTFDEARRAMAGELSRREVAARYHERTPEPA